ncbi:MAG: protease SohB [Hahellaceae bacterium]|jgi:serine protease SohB|nr:protease SohB [Hahellaceae bacterium]MCP5211633.1 protease SohB [Hahellaceae bacterium]
MFFSMPAGQLEVRVLNKEYDVVRRTMNQVSGHKIKRPKFSEILKQVQKRRLEPQGTIFVIDFTGDTHASGVPALAREITAVLETATPEDEVVVRLESPGGVVHGYGLATAQLERIKQANVKLTVCIDKVAASGGYMMACVADKVVAAPLAIVGSIGVIAELPNIHKLLNRAGIEYEQIVAGAYKRPLSIFAENTPEGREKYQEQISRTFELFRQHVQKYRSIKDFDKVADGHVFYGQEALGKNLIDMIETSESLISRLTKTNRVVAVKWNEPVNMMQRLGLAASVVTEAVATKLLAITAQEHRFIR